MTALNQEYIKKIAEVLSTSKRILAITGAGISAESGLPTYRGVGGLYNDGDTEEGLPIETLLSGQMLKQSPEITWKYLLQIEKSCRGAVFNKAHEQLARWQSRFDVTILTQNIDGFHKDAGSENIIDIHGDVHYLQCTNCSYHTRVNDYSELSLPPSCPQCGSLIRPDVVLFGEMLPTDKLSQLEYELTKGFDAIFVIGTTAVFPYIAAPVHMGARDGKLTVEINPADSEVSSIVDYKLDSGAVDALTAIDALLN